MNLIVNNIYGDKYTLSPAHQLFLDSLEKLSNCEKLLVCKDISEEKIHRLDKYYDKIALINDKKFTEMYKDNLGQFYDYLFDTQTLKIIESNYANYDYIFFTDSFDVVIQKDPFEYFKIYEEELFLTSPGFLVQDQWPDKNWHYYYNKTLSFNEYFYNMKVLNGAFVAGKPRAFMDFYTFLISNANRNNNHIVDQTVFLHYYSLVKNRKLIKIFDTRSDDFIYHIQNDIWEGKEEDPTVIDGKIYNNNGNMYCIWHQWNDLNYEAKINVDGKAYLNKITTNLK